MKEQKNGFIQLHSHDNTTLQGSDPMTCGLTMRGKALVQCLPWHYPIIDNLTLPGYPKTRYKSEVIFPQRKILESGTPAEVQNVDISFLYALLWRVCGLVYMYDPAWKDGTMQPTSYDYYIQKLKHLCNVYVHGHDTIRRKKRTKFRKC